MPYERSTTTNVGAHRPTTNGEGKRMGTQAKKPPRRPAGGARKMNKGGTTATDETNTRTGAGETNGTTETANGGTDEQMVGATAAASDEPAWEIGRT